MTRMFLTNTKYHKGLQNELTCTSRGAKLPHSITLASSSYWSLESVSLLAHNSELSLVANSNAHYSETMQHTNK